MKARGFTLLELLIVIYSNVTEKRECRNEAKAQCVELSYDPMMCKAHIENSCQ